MELNRDNEIEESKIVAYFNGGGLSDEERAQMRQWLQDERNHNHAVEVYKLWQMTAMLSPQEIDTAKGFESLRSRLDLKSPAREVKLNWWTYFSAAAALLVIGLCAVYFITSRSAADFVQVAKQKEVVALPDGSKMTMNANAEARYSLEAFAKERVVRVTGEVFFEVEHRGDAFIVETEFASIQVLGTKFLVRAVEDRKRGVIVSEGRVLVVDKAQKKEYILNAGAELVFGGDMGINQADMNDLYWVTGELKFENNILGDVFEEIEKAYGTKIEVADTSIRNCRLTATFQRMPLSTVLAVIAKTHHLTFDTKTDRIIVNGNGCK